MHPLRPESEAFERAVAKTIEREGGPNTVEDDKGGTTNYGISQRFLQSVSDGPVTNAFVLGLSYSDALEIYRKYFWYAPKIHKIPSDTLREVVFDQAVNRGPGSTVKNLQAALKAQTGIPLVGDGIIGQRTIAAVHACEDLDELVMEFVYQCQISYVRICKADPTQLKFIEGWINRTWYYI